MLILQRCWITFERSKQEQFPFSLGCGVTAFSLEDALQMIHEAAAAPVKELIVREVIENIDISTLDELHIIPNIGTPVLRGIWFPNIQ